ncbi:MAG: methionine synthase, partial [bacterium (Candidatus Stahlbacteria) CG23_combo_of_CG06-09_8_20_14_all_40_9]
PKAIVDYLKQQKRPDEKRQFAQTLVERIHQHQPFPLLRHHLGLKTVEETIEAARQIALSEELDILSIAPDQNAQEYFFRPQDMPPTESGAGGVPIRKPEDLRAIYEATRCGNFP